MNSPRRRRDRPVGSVELRISIRADKATSRKIKEALPSAVETAGGCVVDFSAEEPEDVAVAARELLEKVRAIENAKARA